MQIPQAGVIRSLAVTMALAMATVLLPQHSSGQSEAPSQDRVTETEMGPETEGTATPEAGMETDMVFGRLTIWPSHKPRQTICSRQAI